jgi:glycosyltransferase involved in cell wall biosynthesis
VKPLGGKGKKFALMTDSTRYAILILINVRWWNATAFYAVNIGRILQKNGHRVIIGCHEKYPAYRMAASYGLRTVNFNFSGKTIPDFLRSFFRLIKFIRQENIRIINSHRSVDHTVAFLAKLITGTKLVITRGDRRRIQRNPLSRLRYRFCDAVVLTCRSLFTQNREIFSPISQKVHIIYGSVDEDHFKVRADRRRTAQKYGIDTKKCVVGLAGRLSPVKDPYTLIQAASRVLKQHREVVFVIAGKPVEIRHQDL